MSRVSGTSVKAENRNSSGLEVVAVENRRGTTRGGGTRECPPITGGRLLKLFITELISDWFYPRTEYPEFLRR
jgi:hypothetical protein